MSEEQSAGQQVAEPEQAPAAESAEPGAPNIRALDFSQPTKLAATRLVISAFLPLW